MKKTILFLVAVVMLSACSETQKKIKVTVTGTSELTDLKGKDFILEDFGNGSNMASDTISLADNNFSKEILIDSTSLRIVYTKDFVIDPFEIVLEKVIVATADNKDKDKANEGSATIKIDKNGYVTVGGSPLNDQIQKYYDENYQFKEAMMALEAERVKEEAEKKLTPKRQEEYNAKFMLLRNDHVDNVIAFVKENINNPVGKYFFLKHYSLFPNDKKEEMMSFATDDIKAEFKK